MTPFLTQAVFLALTLLAGVLAGAALRRPAAPEAVRLAVMAQPSRPASVVVPPVLSVDRTVADLLTRIEALPLPTDSQLGLEAAEAEHAAAVALACAGRSSMELPALFAGIASSNWPRADKQSVLRVLARQWAEYDPQAALAAVRTIDPNTPPEGKDRLNHPLRTTVEITWARRDPASFRDYILAEARRVTEDGRNYFPGPAIVKAEPTMAMDMLFTMDLPFFRENPKTAYPGNPMGYGVNASTTTELNKDYASWITRQPLEAAAWAGEKLATPDLPSGLAFYLIDQLNENGACAAAAPLAAAHLPEDLAAKAMERILPRWLAADRPAAEAWMNQRNTPQ